MTVIRPGVARLGFLGPAPKAPAAASPSLPPVIDRLERNRKAAATKKTEPQSKHAKHPAYIQAHKEAVAMRARKHGWADGLAASFESNVGVRRSPVDTLTPVKK